MAMKIKQIFQQT